MDGAVALQLNAAPPGGDPQPVLLVVDRHDPLSSAALGEEGVEAADAEDAHPGEVLAK
jgi:hypothetical protein